MSGGAIGARFERLGGGVDGRVVGEHGSTQVRAGLAGADAVESTIEGGGNKVAGRTLHSSDLSNLLHTSRVERVL